MFQFNFIYEDGKFLRCEHIHTAVLHTADGCKAVKEDEILGYSFPVTCDFTLQGDSASYAATHVGLRLVQIFQE